MGTSSLKKHLADVLNEQHLCSNDTIRFGETQRDLKGNRLYDKTREKSLGDNVH